MAVAACGSATPTDGFTKPTPSTTSDTGATSVPPLKKVGAKQKVTITALEEVGPQPDTGVQPGTTPPPNTSAAPQGEPIGKDFKHDPNRVGAAQTTSGAGKMSRESIEAALGRSEDSFGQCVESSSTFSARVTVAPNGSVSEARVTQSSPDDARVRDCLTEALRRLSFPSTNAPVPLSFSLAIDPL
ncbi:MAG: hypothetical protein U0414_04230 [Polyangiaceae bacterium]